MSSTGRQSRVVEIVAEDVLRNIESVGDLFPRDTRSLQLLGPSSFGQVRRDDGIWDPQSVRYRSRYKSIPTEGNDATSDFNSVGQFATPSRFAGCPLPVLWECAPTSRPTTEAVWPPSFDLMPEPDLAALECRVRLRKPILALPSPDCRAVYAKDRGELCKAQWFDASEPSIDLSLEPDWPGRNSGVRLRHRPFLVVADDRGAIDSAQGSHFGAAQ
jgi:hypothetical protein